MFGKIGRVIGDVLHQGVAPGLRGVRSMSRKTMNINDALSPWIRTDMTKRSTLGFLGRGTSNIGRVGSILGAGAVAGLAVGAGSAAFQRDPSSAFMGKPGGMIEDNMTLALNNLNRTTGGTGYRNIEAFSRNQGYGFHTGMMR